MRKRCEAPSCGKTFEAKRAAARFCSPACRKRNQRRPDKSAGGSGKVVTLVPPAAEPDDSQPAPDPYAHEGRLTRSTRLQLERAGRLDTSLGVLALMAAEQLDARGVSDTGASIAALMKTYAERLADALKDAKTDADPLDQIRAAAALKLVHGGRPA